MKPKRMSWLADRLMITHLLLAAVLFLMAPHPWLQVGIGVLAGLAIGIWLEWHYA